MGLISPSSRCGPRRGYSDPAKILIMIWVKSSAVIPLTPPALWKRGGEYSKILIMILNKLRGRQQPLFMLHRPQAVEDAKGQRGHRDVEPNERPVLRGVLSIAKTGVELQR